MRKSVKKIIFLAVTAILLVIGLLTLGLYTMSIEDHYGDLQDFYYQSRNGDLMIFGDYKKIGIVNKTWTRIQIVNSAKDTTDLYNWFYDDSYKSGSNKLFSAKGKLALDELEKEIILQKLEKGELKEIMSIEK